MNRNASGSKERNGRLARRTVAVLFVVIGCGGADDHPPTEEPTVGDVASQREGIARSPISAHGNNTCIIGAEGDVECWGGTLSGRSSPDSGPFAKVSAGADTVCGLGEDGSVRCWGRQSMRIAGSYLDVSVGPHGICVVRESGALECLPPSAPGDEPLETRPGPFARVAAGDVFMCGLSPAGLAECWQTRAPDHVYVPEGRFVQVAAGVDHVCVLDEGGRVDCWGGNGEGQGEAPVGAFRRISAGGTGSCGVTESGTVTCWGGAGASPPDDTEFVDVAASGSHGCGITLEGGPRCWGMSLGALAPTSPAAAGTLGEAEPVCAAEAGDARFDCELERGWLSRFRFQRANSEPFQQQFGSVNVQDVWVSDSEATLATGEAVSALTLYTGIDPDDLTARLEGTMSPDTYLLHHSPGNDRFELMVKGSAGSRPETNDWWLTRLLVDGSTAPPAATSGYGEPGRTCMSCHVMDGRQERTDLLWGIPRAVAP